MTSTASLPIALRAESFGGLLFDPADASFVELDAEGFDTIWRHSLHPSEPLSAPETAFLSELQQQVGSFDRRRFRHIRPMPSNSQAPVPTLSAPTLVDFQITDKCHLDCPHCYASSTSAGEHGSIEDIEMALDQIAEVGAFQVAIGGGEPLLHPQLERILARCHELGLVPNLTTSGLNLGARELQFMARYCGAVGVSLEGVEENFATVRKSGFARFERIVSKLQEQNIPVVLQVTLSSRVLSMLPEIVAYCARQADLYGVIFLAYKPVGRGRDFDQPLATVAHSEVHQYLQHAFDELSPRTRVGFDCCMTPGVTGTNNEYDDHAAYYLEGCSALRTSIGLSPTLDVMPCTFTAEYAVGNLHDEPLWDIWSGMASGRFRGNMAEKAARNSSCSSCAKHSYCLGGCPVMELVNCARDYLSHVPAPKPMSIPVAFRPSST